MKPHSEPLKGVLAQGEAGVVVRLIQRQEFLLRRSHTQGDGLPLHKLRDYSATTPQKGVAQSAALSTNMVVTYALTI